MNRRNFLKVAVTGSFAAGIATPALAAGLHYFPEKVDPTLFETINRVKNPAKKSGLEMKHVPVLTAPASVKAGEPFRVEVAVGESLHPMGPAHWIGFIELSIGNEPAGRIDFQPRGYLQPKVVFSMVVPKDAAPAGRVTLVAKGECNIHGLWEGSIDVAVT